MMPAAMLLNLFCEEKSLQSAVFSASQSRTKKQLVGPFVLRAAITVPCLSGELNHIRLLYVRTQQDAALAAAVRVLCGLYALGALH